MVRVAGYLYCFYKTQEQCQWDSIGHRRLSPESTFTFPDQAARFQRKGYKPVQRPLSRMISLKPSRPPDTSLRENPCP